VVINLILGDREINIIKNILIKSANPYLAYIFGSSVQGIFREDSDIDIAFLSDRTHGDYEVFMIAQEIAAEFNRDVDLIDLSKASTVFKAQVVGTGKVIYCTDELKRMNFEMYSLKDYALLNEEREIILRSIKERGSVYGN
jgi:predicted nucleotidyltransferase